MHRILKIICLLGVMSLLLAGCSSPETGTGGNKAEPAVSLTALQYEIDNIAVDFSKMWFYQQLEAKTGVHVDFSEVKDSE